MPGKRETPAPSSGRPDGLVVPLRTRDGNISAETTRMLERRTEAFQRGMNRKGAPYAFPSPRARA